MSQKVEYRNGFKYIYCEQCGAGLERILAVCRVVCVSGLPKQKQKGEAKRWEKSL